MAENLDIGIVREWLGRYREIQIENDYQRERLERMICAAENVGSPKMSDMPRAPSPSMDKMSDYVQRKNELMEQIGEIFEKSKTMRAQIEAILAFIVGAEEKMVVRYRYIDAMEWKDIVDVLYCEKEDLLVKWDNYQKAAFTQHRKAVEDMTKVILEHGGEKGVPTLIEIAA